MWASKGPNPGKLYTEARGEHVRSRRGGFTGGSRISPPFPFGFSKEKKSVAERKREEEAKSSPVVLFFEIFKSSVSGDFQIKIIRQVADSRIPSQQISGFFKSSCSDDRLFDFAVVSVNFGCGGGGSGKVIG